MSHGTDVRDMYLEGLPVGSCLVTSFTRVRESSSDGTRESRILDGVSSSNQSPVGQRGRHFTRIGPRPK